jgi:hypothetical protein
MKNQFIILLSLVVIFNYGCATSEPLNESTIVIEDGLYCVSKIDTVAAHLSPLNPGEKAIFFNKMFDEFNDGGYHRIIIDTTDYVPLELREPAKSEQVTEQKKNLLLSLTPEASKKLKTFSSKHVMDEVIIVVDGEALTMHKIREPLTSGQLQITRCHDNACELVLISLEDNVLH